MDKVFLDTNIVADALDTGRAGHAAVLELIEHLTASGHAICISEDMLSTLYYISKDKNATLEFFKHVIFVDWEVLTFGPAVRAQAVEIALSENADLEDVLQSLCAQTNGCNALITNDTGFYRGGAAVFSVREFMARHDPLLLQ